MTRYTKNRPSRKLMITAIIIVLVVLVGGTYVFFGLKSSNDNNSKGTSDSQKIDYGPPNEEEQEAGDIQKDKNIEDAQNTTVPSTANVVISDASQYGSEIEVRSFVSNVLDDGTCTITFAKASSSFSREVPATQDATTTLCRRLIVNRSDFSSAGDWKVTVTYYNNDRTIMGSSSQNVTLQ